MPDVPTPDAYFLSTPLYSRFALDEHDAAAVVHIEFYDRTLDTFCVSCSRDSVFQSSTRLPDVSGRVDMVIYPRRVEELVTVHPRALLPVPGDNALTRQDLTEYAFIERYLVHEFRCTRDNQHRMLFVSLVAGGELCKIGQHPSRADLEQPTFLKYRRLLGDEKYRELIRGIGLAAHGIGIGSFVYLRRIFEDLIDAARTLAESQDGWDEDQYRSSRMDERIRMLSDLLPPFLVENRALYGILSSGIHTLTEDACLELFEPVRMGIELILDQRLAQDEQERKAAEAGRAVRAVADRLKGASDSK